MVSALPGSKYCPDVVTLNCNVPRVIANHDRVSHDAFAQGANKLLVDLVNEQPRIVAGRAVECDGARRHGRCVGIDKDWAIENEI